MTAIANNVTLDAVCLGAPTANQFPVAASTHIYEGQFVAIISASGYAQGPDGTTGTVQGIAAAECNNTSTAGAQNVNVVEGCFWRPNYATHPVLITHVGTVCYASDNYTVSSNSGDGPVAGIVKEIDTTLGVLVECRQGMNYLLSQATLSSNLASIVHNYGASLIGIEDAGGFTLSATVEAALAEIYQHLESAHARKEIPLGEFVIMAGSGVPLSVHANGTDGVAGTWCDSASTPKAKGIMWNPTSGTTSTLVASVMSPADADLTKAVYLKIKASKLGATTADACTFVVGVFAQTDAALYDAGTTLGATSGAMTGNAATKTVQLVSTTLTAWASSAVGLTVTINPTAAKLSTDYLILHNCWFEYSRKLATT